MWADLAPRIARTTARREEPSWAAMRALTGATVRHAKARVEELQRVVRESERLLSPLPDPLRVDFSLNRWLAEDREEAYSDWLAWILERISTASQISALLFGESAPAGLLGVSTPCSVDREQWVPSGHPGRAGRLDCVLRFGKEAIIVIEVKVVGVESADTVKQAGYWKWLQAENVPITGAVLLATSREQPKEYDCFRLLQWEEFCVRARRLLPQIAENNDTSTALLVAAFIGAVEQNLLTLPSLASLDHKLKPAEALLLCREANRVEAYIRAAWERR